MTATGSNPLPARSDGLDNVDGGPDAAFYIQLRVIEQVSIRSRFQGGRGAILVAFVASEDIRQHHGLVGVLAAGPRLQGTAAGPNPGVGDHENLHIGVGADHSADIAAIKHRAGRTGREMPLKIHQHLPHPRKRRDHRGGLADDLALQHRISEFFGVEFHRGGDRECLNGQVGAGIEQRLGHRAIDHAGIEVAIAVVVSKPLAERALAGSGRSVDGDDHADL
jgi:hypothetical protein